jgi:hypothetical protein
VITCTSPLKATDTAKSVERSTKIEVKVVSSSSPTAEATASNAEESRFESGDEYGE